MLDQLRHRLTYANVMATIAVFGVLAGGGAYAASQITAKDIAKNAVRSKHIKKNAVKTPKIKDGAITEAKLGEEVKGAHAYAVIDPSTCTTAPDSCTLLRAKNVVAARRSPNNPTGFYCVTTGPGIDRAADGFMAGVEWQETQPPAGTASAMPSTDPPPAAAQVCPDDFTVATERPPIGPSPNLVNDVAFWFAVP